MLIFLFLIFAEVEKILPLVDDGEESITEENREHNSD